MRQVKLRESGVITYYLFAIISLRVFFSFFDRTWLREASVIRVVCTS